MFRISHAADLAGVSDDTIRRHVEKGDLAVQIDSSNRQVVDGVDLGRFIQDYTKSGRIVPRSSLRRATGSSAS
jgi:predicted site-specific integrase-resolvase